jgi:TonB family protein
LSFVWLLLFAVVPSTIGAQGVDVIAKCIGYGFKAGTPEHANCVKQYVRAAGGQKAVISIPAPIVTPPIVAVKSSLTISPARLAKGMNLGEACESYYPLASRRLSEEGSVVILFKVLTNGLVGETKIETSSGYPSLDEATATCLATQGRFEPEMLGNAVHESWQRLKYTWRLH